MKPTFLVLDSGVGGISYAAEVHKRSGCTVLAIADSAGFPYGRREHIDLRNHLLRLADKALAEWPADVLVLACNTASVVALEALRQKLGIPVVGVVPAVKLAADRFPGEAMVVLGTSTTVRDSYLDRLVAEFAGDSRVERLAADPLVAAIESGNAAALEEELAGLGRWLGEQQVQQVVLGCTHFILARAEIAALTGGSRRLHDSVAGVARQAMRVGPGCAKNSPGSLHAVATSPSGRSSLLRLRERFAIADVRLWQPS